MATRGLPQRLIAFFLFALLANLIFALPIQPPTTTAAEAELVARMAGLDCEALYSEDTSSPSIHQSKVSWCKATIERRVDGERTRMGTAWKRSLEADLDS